MEALHEGSKVVAGTVLGRIGKTDELAPHLHFAIQPTGRGAPKIDPKPILDGWKLLEATAIYRAAGKNPFAGSGASVGQILLMSKEQLVRRTLADPRLEIYSCGREDIQTGQIDRRVLALLEYLTERGYRLTLTSLKCGHSVYTTSVGISPALDRQRRRHRPDQRPPGARQPGPGLDHRGARQGRPVAPGHDDAGPGDLADEPRRPELRDGGPRRPRARRVPAAVRRPARRPRSSSSRS